MNHFLTIVFFIFSFTVSFSQKDSTTIKKPLNKFTKQVDVVENPKAKHEQYKIYSIEKDTTYIDTSLTIKSDYNYNYLRKDIFGLMPFANEGQAYLSLVSKSNITSAFPEFGFTSKHYSYIEKEAVNYYSVATPLTELYFKTVMEQGQSVDALVTLNTSERFNLSIAYRGLRSLGKYQNQLSSIGNFRFTSSYFTKKNRYNLNFHFTGQDILNGENGGIIEINDFENGNEDFSNRARFSVYLNDAKSFMKGKRIFIDHHLRINKNDAENNILLSHQFIFENKFYEFNQKTLSTTINNDTFNRFGESFVSSNLNDQVSYNQLYNKIGVTYQNKTLGTFQFFVEDFNYNYNYDKVVIINDNITPNRIHNRLNSFGATYQYIKNNWRGKATISKAISKETFSTIDVIASYKLNEKNNFTAQYQNISKVPNHNFILHQSSYLNYNWKNNFENEKTNNLIVSANTQYINLSAQATIYNDYLYFSDDSNDQNIQLITPKQYSKAINYFSIKASKEIKYKKFALDNTLLYQKISQENNILNLPQLVARNTLYYSNHFFKKAMFTQIGLTANYFSKHYANDFNPILNESFIQTNKEIGNFPMVDFFVNARIRQTRVFLKAEHLNTIFTKENNHLTAPNYPFHDFMIRFGLVWNFFQ